MNENVCVQTSNPDITKKIKKLDTILVFPFKEQSRVKCYKNEAHLNYLQYIIHSISMYL